VSAAALAEALRPSLAQRRQQQLYRSRRTVSGSQGPVLLVDGQPLLNFCSNDYLGLAAHPAITEALQQAAATDGVGSGASHLICGHSDAHHALEQELAAFTNRPRALLFSTGYMANIGVISALLGRNDTIYQDRLNHASLVDGGLLSRARSQRFRHADVAALAQQLQAHGSGRALVVTDGLFSMDGDLAPLPAMADLCRQQGAWLMVDDAHGLGVLGEQGGGSVAHFGLDMEQVPILIGTLGKAFGTFGAFVAGPEELIETLIQQARSYIFTTAMPAAVAAATRVSLQIVQRERWRRERLHELVQRFRAGVDTLGLPLMPSDTPIQPILAGSAARAQAWSQTLLEQGLLVSAIRPPTVAEGSARLRVTLSAGHSDAQLQQLLEALARLPQDPP